MANRQQALLFSLSSVVAISWMIWSFTLTDPNLYYSSSTIWVNVQQTLWKTPRNLIVAWYLANCVGAYLLYILAQARSLQAKSVLRFALLFSPLLLLLLSNVALSHDLFNYLFNAKAVVVYQADPHQRSALEIAPQDEWARFLHNSHTPAPYGYVWTYASLVPFIAGVGKFVTTFLAFKLWMCVGLGVLLYFQWRLVGKWQRLLLFLLNPLVLVETLLNGHNDVWMMALAMGSLVLIVKETSLFSYRTLLSALLLLLSTQIKLATVLLLPIWLLLHNAIASYFKKQLRLQGLVETLRLYWAELASVLMFLPLVTDRSQQFHPWYLIWSLSFLPSLRSSLLQYFLLAFSLTSLLRYLPFLLVGEYTDTIQFQMRVITWSAVGVGTLLTVGLKKRLS